MVREGAGVEEAGRQLGPLTIRLGSCAQASLAMGVVAWSWGRARLMNV